MKETFTTKDISLAVYLKTTGNYCIGTIPAGNKYKPVERLWVFENNNEVQQLVDEFNNTDPVVPVKEAFKCSSILKNLLNDKDNE